MISTMVIDQAQRRVQAFQQRCGEYGEAALHLSYHAALPVALNAELLHLLRINFFLDPPEILPYTVEFEFLLSPLCREIDEGLYEIEPDIRDVLLAGLNQTYDVQRTHDIATLLWQYVDRHSPWFDRVELERAQQLTALNFLNPEKAQQWLVAVETEVSQGQIAAREWFVAMRQDIENQVQLSQRLALQILESSSQLEQTSEMLQQETNNLLPDLMLFKLHCELSADGWLLRVTIRFGQQSMEVPGGNIIVGLRRIEVKLKIENGRLPLETMGLIGSFRTGVELELQQGQTHKTQPHASVPGDIKARNFNKLVTKTTHKISQVSARGTEEEPIWVFEAKAQTILNGLLTREPLGRIDTYTLPCILTATAEIRGQRDVYITEDSGIWTKNISSNKLAVLKKALLSRVLLPKLTPWLSQCKIILE